MKQRLRTVASGTSVSQAARLMKTEQIGFLPVCDQPGHVLGVLTDRDIVLRVCAEGLDLDTTPRFAGDSSASAKTSRSA